VNDVSSLKDGHCDSHWTTWLALFHESRPIGPCPVAPKVSTNHHNLVLTSWRLALASNASISRKLWPIDSFMRHARNFWTFSYTFTSLIKAIPPGRICGADELMILSSMWTRYGRTIVHEGLAVSLEELDNLIPYVSAIFGQSAGDSIAPWFGIVQGISVGFREHARYYGQV
jgi:hypothetical protein